MEITLEAGATTSPAATPPGRSPRRPRPSRRCATRSTRPARRSRAPRSHGAEQHGERHRPRRAAAAQAARVARGPRRRAGRVGQRDLDEEEWRVSAPEGRGHGGWWQPDPGPVRAARIAVGTGWRESEVAGARHRSGIAADGLGAGRVVRAKLHVLDVGVAAPSAGALATRLGSIAAEIDRLITAWTPDRSPSSAPSSGATSPARCASARCAARCWRSRTARLAVVDYPPATVKLAVAGSGAAQKDAVARGVNALTGGRTRPATRPTRSRSRSATCATRASPAG